MVSVVVPCFQSYRSRDPVEIDVSINVQKRMPGFAEANW